MFVHFPIHFEEREMSVHNNALFSYMKGVLTAFSLFVHVQTYQGTSIKYFSKKCTFNK